MSDEMFELVSHHLVQHFGIEPETISPAATLEDIGLDSMALVELLVVLEEGFGMPMPEDDGAAAPKTLGQLVERLETARNELTAAASAGPTPVPPTPAGTGAGDAGADGGAAS